MLGNPTPSVPAKNVFDYEMSDYEFQDDGTSEFCVKESHVFFL